MKELLNNSNAIFGLCFISLMSVKAYGMHLCSRKDISNKKAKYISDIASAKLANLFKSFKS